MAAKVGTHIGDPRHLLGGTGSWQHPAVRGGREGGRASVMGREVDI